MLTPPQTYDEAVAYLDAHVGLGVKPGLERITRLLELMGDPHLQIPVIHVAGTNGKTSTSLLISSLIGTHGLNVGTFTSPHLEAIEERFRLAGEIASPDEFATAVADVAPFVELLEAETGERPTYFELTVAIAFAYFVERAAEVAVIEVGLGGRLDATNVVQPEVAVVTGIGMDHMEYLGNSLAEIAVEKLAIAKPGSVLVTGRLDDEIDSLADARASDVGIRRVAVDRDVAVEEAMLGVGGWAATISTPNDTYEDVFLALHGRHQVDNLAVAIAATEAFFDRGLDPEAVLAAASEVRSPGRIEVLRRNPLVVVDGAHNEQSMRVLAETLDAEFPDLLWTVVFGVLGDKDVEAMLGHLEPMIGRLVVTEADSPRSVPVGQLGAEVRRVLPDIGEVQMAATVGDAVAEVMSEMDADGALLVTGSLYVVGEARGLLAANRT